MSFYRGANIVLNGLIFNLDAANDKSYPRSGAIWRSMIGNYSGSLINGPTYNSQNGGTIIFDGIDDYVATNPVIKIGTNFTGTIEFVSKKAGLIIGNPRTSDSQGNGNIFIRNDGSIQYIMNFNRDPTYSYSLTSSLTSNTGSFNYYAASVTIPGGGVNGTMIGTMCINGFFENVSTAMIANTYTEGNFNTLEIARGYNYIYSTLYYNIEVGFVRIYNRRLSNSEILQNYNAVKSRFNLT